MLHYSHMSILWLSGNHAWIHLDTCCWCGTMPLDLSNFDKVSDLLDLEGLEMLFAELKMIQYLWSYRFKCFNLFFLFSFFIELLIKSKLKIHFPTLPAHYVSMIKIYNYLYFVLIFFFPLFQEVSLIQHIIFN